jgi:putative membrane protein
MRKLPIALAAASLIGFAASAASAAQLSAQDEQFVRQAAQGGMEEVQAGRMAQQQGGSQDVKQMGQVMVADHTLANNQLKQIARQQGFSLPQTLDQEQQQDVQQLRKLRGTDFDKQFANQEVQDHTKMIRLFQNEAQNTQDQALRNFAQTNLPVLQKHLQMAQQAQSAS